MNKRRTQHSPEYNKARSRIFAKVKNVYQKTERYKTESGEISEWKYWYGRYKEDGLTKGVHIGKRLPPSLQKLLDNRVWSPGTGKFCWPRSPAFAATVKNPLSLSLEVLDKIQRVYRAISYRKDKSGKVLEFKYWVGQSLEAGFPKSVFIGERLPPSLQKLLDSKIWSRGHYHWPKSKGYEALVREKARRSGLTTRAVNSKGRP